MFWGRVIADPLFWVKASESGVENEKSLPGDVAIIRRQALQGYLKSKLQALRIPFTLDAKLAEGVAKFKEENFDFDHFVPNSKGIKEL